MKDSQNTDRIEAQQSAQPPEDVAVLYSWANMHGARYRDFSDSRREYRAQLRQRSTEQAGEHMAETSGDLQTVGSGDSSKADDTTAARRGTEDAVRRPVPERIEAASARGGGDLVEVQGAGQPEAARYTGTEVRQREDSVQPHPSLEEVRPNRYRRVDDFAGEMQSTRRRQGYRPEEASGVREIYRGTEAAPAEDGVRVERERRAAPPVRQQMASPDSMYGDRPSAVIYRDPSAKVGEQRPPDRRYLEQRRADALSEQQIPERRAGRIERDVLAAKPLATEDPGFAARREDLARQAAQRFDAGQEVRGSQQDTGAAAQVPRGRRAQDDFDYKHAAPFQEPLRRPVPEQEIALSTQRAQFAAEPPGPAWLYAPPTPPAAPKPRAAAPVQPQPSVAETLQHSRERVASRWYALKGVFEQPGQELPEAIPVRQKETRTPVLAVFSLAGGVGKTSMVATVGRALSSLGEKVLLTDTTSHGLLPFYFGASELRPDTVRTFSPPSGSTDAPIYLVSHEVEQKGDDEAQQKLVEEIIGNGRGSHRILMDLTAQSSWIVRKMARSGPTILVPLAPDMNSVISLQAVERYFQGLADVDGRPVQPYYVLNQFDSSLPLHLDVREVLRRQLGDRLLPFVIRNAPVVSEALAEGMTVIDYAPDAPVAEDYRNLATWVRGIAAPATAGFRNVRWSER